MTENKRIIKFRGKCIGDVGNWAFGYYHFDAQTNSHYIVTEEGLLRKEVVAETVGQFTGLLDNNGKEIYEGDILCPFNEDIGPYSVVFENGSFVCYHKLGKWGLLSRIFEVAILSNYQPVVIGNIYENYGDLYDPAMEVQNKEEADAYFKRLVEHQMKYGAPEEVAIQSIKTNLAYWAAYGDDETRERVERLYECEHPYFGSIALNGPPSMEEALQLGGNKSRGEGPQTLTDLRKMKG